MAVLWRRAEAKSDEARASAAAAGRRRDEAREALRLYAVAAHRLYRSSDLTEPERVALDRALELTLAALEDTAGDPDEEHRTAFAILQGAHVLWRLGDNDRAWELGRRAVAVLRRLADAHPDRPNYLYDYAQGCNQLAGTLYTAGRPAEAVRYVREAVRVGDDLTARFPASERYRTGHATFQAALAAELSAAGDRAAADRLFAHSLDAQRDLLAKYPEDPDRYDMLAAALERYERHVLAAARPDPDRLAEVVRERLDRCERALAARPDRPALARLLIPEPRSAIALDRLGQTGDADAAAARAIAVCRVVAAAAPNDAEGWSRYATWLSFGACRRWPTDPRGAGELFLRGIVAAGRANPPPGQAPPPRPKN
jgi:hypothetical protein